MHVGFQMPGVGTPMIGVVAGQSEGLDQRFELQEDLIFSAAKAIRQDRSCMMIDRMPQPVWVPFVANKRPHLIHLSFASLLNIHGKPSMP